MVFLEVSGLGLEVTRELALICYSGAIFVMGAARNERRDSAQVQLVSGRVMGCLRTCQRLDVAATRARERLLVC